MSIGNIMQNIFERKYLDTKLIHNNGLTWRNMQYKLEPFLNPRFSKGRGQNGPTFRWFAITYFWYCIWKIHISRKIVIVTRAFEDANLSFRIIEGPGKFCKDGCDFQFLRVFCLKSTILGFSPVQVYKKFTI